MSKILIIENDMDLVLTIEDALKKAGFEVIKAYDGRAGLKLIVDKNPDLIILAQMLSEISGTELCKILKIEDKTADIPILMLTQETEQVELSSGHEIGADEYISRPFNMNDLMLKLLGILKRSSETISPLKPVLKFLDLEVDPNKQEVLVLGKKVLLTAKEFDLLCYLIERKNTICVREALLSAVWGAEVIDDSRTVDTHIKTLRQKLGVAKEHIVTLRGVGYKFRA